MKRPQKHPAMHAALDRQTCALAQAVADRWPDFQQMIFTRDGTTTQWLSPLRKLAKGETRLWRTKRKRVRKINLPGSAGSSPAELAGSRSVMKRPESPGAEE